VRRRLTALAAEKESGVTLVELMVSIFLGLIVMAMVGGFFMQSTRITSSAVQSNTSNGVASDAMQEINSVIRFATKVTISGGYAPPVVSGSSTKLVVTANLNVTNPADPAPTQVTFDSSSGSIIESRCLAQKSGGYWSFSSCASTSTRNLGGPIVAPTAGQNALFSYLDGTGATLALTNGNLPATANVSVSTITVSVKVQSTGMTQMSPVYLSANIAMPNLGFQTKGSGS
jgi:type II secretory pathway pseudopilin PulG